MFYTEVKLHFLNGTWTDGMFKHRNGDIACADPTEFNACNECTICIENILQRITLMI